MGVPGLYRYLQQHFPSACTTATRLDTAAQTLFVDLNGIIHREARYSNGRIGPIVAAISDIVGLVQPTKLLFLAIDGVPPRIKERLQRERRARPTNITRWNGTGSSFRFQGYMVTPGTQWMRTLEARIRELVKTKRNEGKWGNGLRVVFSGSRVPGEGEHKIFECLRKQQDVKGRHIVWSGDADSLLLALASRSSRIFVVSERQMEVRTFTMTDIDMLRTQLISRFAPNHKDTLRAAEDLVFLTLLAGNDFLPPLTLLGSSDAAGITELWSLYKQLNLPPQEYLHDRGRINTISMMRLLRVLVQRIEDPQFHRYIAVTRLGPRVSALMARRSRWAAYSYDTSTALLSDKPRTSRNRSCREQTMPPLVRVGCVAVLAECSVLAQGPGVQPIGIRQPHFLAAEQWRVTGPVLALDGLPLVSLVMLSPLRWIITEARVAQSTTATALFATMSPEQQRWLRLAAEALGMRLRTASAKATTATRGMLEFRLVRHAPPSEKLLDSVEFGSLAMVANDTWDMLVGDAQTQQQRDAAVVDWSTALYGTHASVTVRTRLSHIYAVALAWTAQYYFGTSVGNWTFEWPDDIDVSPGVAPLPSDLLAYIEQQLDDSQWPIVYSDTEDVYDPSLSLPYEHMLCVLPLDAHSDAEDLQLAKLLYDTGYSESSRAQVRLQTDTTEPLLVDIWL